MDAVRAKGLGRKTRKALEGMGLYSEGAGKRAIVMPPVTWSPCALWGLSPKGLQAF